MGIWTERGIVEEMKAGTNLAYILKDNSSFVKTEYKALQSQTDSVFAGCVKMLFNGRIELCYLVGSYKTLSEVLVNANNDRINTVLYNLFKGYIRVRNTGFLHCNGIESEADHIFVDLDTLKVRFVYLPLGHMNMPENQYDNTLRADLIECINQNKSLMVVDKNKIVDKLGDKSMSFEMLSEFFGGEEQEKTENSECKMKLVSLDSVTQVEIEINKPEFTIGRNETNDFVCTKQTISGQHCKILRDGKRFMVQEWLGFRSNKTYVNGNVLNEGDSVYLNDGDVLQIADSRFKVVI